MMILLIVIIVVLIALIAGEILLYVKNKNVATQVATQASAQIASSNGGFSGGITTLDGNGLKVGSTTIDVNGITVGNITIKNGEINVNNKIKLTDGGDVVTINVNPSCSIVADKDGSFNIINNGMKSVKILNNDVAIGNLTATTVKAGDDTCGYTNIGCKSLIPQVWSSDKDFGISSGIGKNIIIDSNIIKSFA